MKRYNTTKKEMFAEVIEIVKASDNANKAEIIERLEREIELATKKSTSKASAEKVARDNELTAIIAEVLSDGKARTVSEIQNADSRLSLAEGISNSKVTSLLTVMVKAEAAKRIVDKKKSYYSI